MSNSEIIVLIVLCCAIFVTLVIITINTFVSNSKTKNIDTDALRQERMTLYFESLSKLYTTMKIAITNTMDNKKNAEIDELDYNLSFLINEIRINMALNYENDDAISLFCDEHRSFWILSIEKLINRIKKYHSDSIKTSKNDAATGTKLLKDCDASLNEISRILNNYIC